MKKLRSILPVLISSLALAFGMAADPGSFPGQTVTPPSLEDRARIEELIAEDVALHSEVMAFHIYDVRVDSMNFSDDGNWALTTLAYYTPGTNTVVPTEPGLALARRIPGDWKVTLQVDSDWATVLQAAPGDLLSTETKKVYQPPSPEEEHLAPKAIGGYKLPWPAGQTKYLSQSVAHPAGETYAYDFYDPATPMWPIVASRTGTVKYAVWAYPNGYYDGNANHANYLILEDTSTVPTTYQVYLHLAQDSIPVALRTVGTRVYRGQFLGIADDTGYSTGSHLHFQIHTNSASWWGNAIDITFDDVAINGGRPRTPAEASWYGGTGAVTYISGNTSATDFTPPTADLTAPEDHSATALSTVHLAGWANDTGGSGFSYAYFIADWGTGWQQVSPVFSNSPFATDWNLCGDGVPVGPVSISVRAWDRDGNPVTGYPGLRTILHTASCPPPPPACSPTADQVALYAKPDFAGECTVQDIGDYDGGSWLAPVGSRRAESIRVGANVLATAFSEENFFGRAEGFSADDRNLGDNAIGADNIVSLRVSARNITPEAPTLLWPPAGAAFNQGDALVLSWRGGLAGLYSLVETDPTGPLGEQRPIFRSLDGTATRQPGTYQWYILERSCSGSDACNSEWRARTYTVNSAPALPAPVTAPFADTLESGAAKWTATGLWRLASSPVYSGTHAWVYNQSLNSNYDTGAPNAGFLTSPPVVIPATGYFLHFRSWTDAELGNVWDQRRIQVSVDGGNFVNLFQMTDDIHSAWIAGPAINLSAYAGHTIRIRFAFYSLDEWANQNQGWAIDDFAVNTTGPGACTDTQEPNDTAATAAALAVNTPLSGQICGAGDEDFFRFTATAGSRIVARLENFTNLRPHLEILGDDGGSVLSISDGNSVGYAVPQTGTYYVKLRSQNHPADGGPDQGYSLRLLTDSDMPVVSWLTPAASGGFLGGSSINLAVSASDTGGIQKVDIFRHGPDWGAGAWTKVCTDSDGSNGWSCAFSPGSLPEGAGYAFYALATDWVGNQATAAVWNFTLDRTAPSLTATPLPAAQTSTVVNLQWTASDAVSGVAYANILVRVDGDAWTNWMTNIPPATTSVPYSGGPGHSYGFRIQVFDRAGNSAQADLATTLTGCNKDSYENDNSAIQAGLMTPGAQQIHSVCPSGDSDWVYFQAVEGQTYLLQALANGPTAWIVLDLMDTDGVTVLLEALPPDNAMIGQGASICWTAPRDGIFFLRARHADPNAAGDETSFVLKITTGYCGYLPGILR